MDTREEIRMGMNGKLRRIAPQDVLRFREDEQFRNSLTMAGLGPAPDLASGLSILPWYVRWPMRFLLRKQIRALAQAKTSGTAPAPANDLLDLHKSWHGLHFLLTQSSWEGPEPYRSAILGGEEVGDDLGYGPPRLVLPETVEDVARALSALSASQLMTRFDPATMDREEIYPGGFVEDSSWKRDLRRDYERLRDFYAETAAQGSAVISWID